MEHAYLFDAIRTPRGKGKKDGSMHSIKAIDLVAGLMQALQQRHQLDTAQIDDVVLGCVTPVGEQGADIAKTAALVAGWDWQVAGVQLNRFCASGLEAVNLAAQKVRSGWEDLVVAGGVESMSRVPMGSDGGAWANDPATSLRTDFMPQGIGADLIASIDGYQREQVDAFALRSQQKAAAAQAAGHLRSIVPVHDQNGVLVLDHDEFIKPHTTMETLAGLKPSFAQLGALGFDAMALQRYPQLQQVLHVHTAGNSSGIVDGAALALIGSLAAGQRLGLPPRARIVSVAVTGSDPAIMLTGPAPAARKALQKAGLEIADIDLFEVNEAFASVVLRFMAEMGVPEHKVNVNGGAIALGHPLGATGCMLLATLLDELEARQLKRGMVTLCVGGGMGIATIIERV
ncbi:acetyl-CoA C-acetyltransferase [Duganella qianjiadongensis]|uniref:Acetyl-CoA C-acetyltransferase n=1 Tax=Duganella qianjiadongensis TaxID=2692176 RepID=A0ABW9VK68_9BURK|nr:acetyl-CoA C-acetyltransferase [Duganella qianjiadongensis]MYM39813.1 acetyl-CoA C-acetyltransferase [Duganella qianjiadongensis]